MSTLSATLTSGITLGNPGYLSPLTISQLGAILPTAAVATGIYSNIAGLSLENQGLIAGGPGTVGVGLYQGINQARGSGPGGAGVSFTASGTFTNLGAVAGGTGGAGQDNTTGGGIGGAGGAGGYALQLGGGRFSNQATITGGGGGQGGSGGPAGYSSITYGGGGGGRGGIGAYLSGVAASNLTTITGGVGGAGGTGGGQGGYGARYGVEAIGGTFTNSGAVIGGAGGTGGSAGYGGGVGGNGGVAILESGGSLFNAGLIEGGAGGNAGDGSTMNLVIGTFDLGTRGGQGGIGADLSGGIMINLAQADILGGGGGGAGPNNANGGPGGAGLRIYSGEMTNFGEIIGGDGAEGSDGGTIGAGGVGVQLFGGTLVNAGLIEGGNGATAVLGENSNLNLIIEPGAAFIGAVIGATNAASGFLYQNYVSFAPGNISLNLYNSFQSIRKFDFENGTDVTLSGQLTADQIVNSGTIDVAAPGYLTITGPISGSGVIIDDPSTISFNGAVSSGQTVRLAGAGDVLVLGTPGRFAGTITNFQIGDAIDLLGFTASSETYVSGTGLVLSDGTSTITLDIQGDFPSGTIAVSSGTGGTQLELCFLRGTRILTPTGERSVEDLSPGDLAVTRTAGFQPIKWIGVQLYHPRCNANPPVRIKAGALGQHLPARDLIVSPGHSLLLDGVLVLAKNLVNGITIVHETLLEHIEYFGIELETHDCLLAQGCWAESFADGPGLRRQFHNFDDFLSRFPDYTEPLDLALCAPRHERGPDLAAALLPIVSRAASLVQPGRLRGWIDVVSPDGRIEGWAQDLANPELPVLLEFIRGEEVIATALACDYRGDLAQAGIGSGHAMFSITLTGGDLRVRRAGTQDELVRSDACRVSHAA